MKRLGETIAVALTAVTVAGCSSGTESSSVERAIDSLALPSVCTPLDPSELEMLQPPYVSENVEFAATCSPGISETELTQNSVMSVAVKVGNSVMRCAVVDVGALDNEPGKVIVDVSCNTN